MGAQSKDRSLENYDPNAHVQEGPPQSITLDPFFLSKYEMTQGQWLACRGENPSFFHEPEPSDPSDPLSHPVEQVSWEDCRETVERLGLVLPTEAQWEYAARGGTRTPWWTGGEPQSIQGAANIADQSFGRYFATVQRWESWLDDGYGRHAPVGSFRANPFGLHDTVGNVTEWCRDWIGPYSERARSGDGERMASGLARSRHARWLVQHTPRNRCAPRAAAKPHPTTTTARSAFGPRGSSTAEVAWRGGGTFESRSGGSPSPFAHSTGLMSTTGVPSMASIGPMRRRVPSIARTVTG
jgi:formylglycine-generating enzyme required for sulfatase activity